LQELEQNWAEPLHEYTQFASIIKKLLAYRHQKHVQYEMTQDALGNKREQLEELDKSEREARRLEEALGRSRVNATRRMSQSHEEGATEENAGEPGAALENTYIPPHPGPNPTRRRTQAPGMGLLNALSFTLHGMMDVDPETARRNGITKTRETISQVHIDLSPFVVIKAYRSIIQLEDALHLSAQDLKYSSSTIQADLDRFQRQKVADLREMAISMARSHRDWCRKVTVLLLTASSERRSDFLDLQNLEAWEEAKNEIEKIPDHPNHTLPTQETAVAGGGPSHTRGDSTVTINGR